MSAFPVHKYERVWYINMSVFPVHINVSNAKMSVFPVHTYQLVSSAQVHFQLVTYEISVYFIIARICIIKRAINRIGSGYKASRRVVDTVYPL